MGQDEIKGIFFENPSKAYHIREIARLLKMSKTAVGYHINRLIKKELILVKKGVFKEYAANMSEIGQLMTGYSLKKNMFYKILRKV